MDHRNDVNNVQNKTETTLLRLVVSLQNYKERAFFLRHGFPLVFNIGHFPFSEVS